MPIFNCDKTIYNQIEYFTKKVGVFLLQLFNFILIFEIIT